MVVRRGLGLADGVGLLEGGGRAVRPVVGAGQGSGAGGGGGGRGAAAGAPRRAEGRVDGVLPRVVYGLGARRGRVEERVRELPHAPRHLQRPLRVRLEDAVE